MADTVTTFLAGVQPQLGSLAPVFAAVAAIGAAARSIQSNKALMGTFMLRLELFVLALNDSCKRGHSAAVEAAVPDIIALLVDIRNFMTTHAFKNFPRQVLQSEDTVQVLIRHHASLSRFAQPLHFTVTFDNDGLMGAVYKDLMELSTMLRQHENSVSTQVLETLYDMNRYMEFKLEGLPPEIRETSRRNHVFTQQDLIRKAGRGLMPANEVTVESNDVYVLRDQPIGRGRCGRVFHATWNGRRLVARVMSAVRTQDSVDSLLALARTWSALSHPNLLAFVKLCVNADKPFVLVPTMATNLAAHLASKPETTPAVRLRYMCDVARAVKYLHSQPQPIVHGDLRTNNVLLDAQGGVKVSDFDMGFIKSLSVKQRTDVLRWMAPETHKRKTKPATSSDVFAFAMTFYHVLTSRMPFDDEPDDEAVKQQIKTGKRPARVQALPASVWQLAEDCWSQTPSSRPRFPAIVERIEAIPNEDLPSLAELGINTLQGRLSNLSISSAVSGSSQPAPVAGVAASPPARKVAFDPNTAELNVFSFGPAFLNPPNAASGAERDTLPAAPPSATAASASPRQSRVASGRTSGAAHGPQPKRRQSAPQLGSQPAWMAPPPPEPKAANSSSSSLSSSSGPSPESEVAIVIKTFPEWSLRKGLNRKTSASFSETVSVFDPETNIAKDIPRFVWADKGWLTELHLCNDGIRGRFPRTLSTLTNLRVLDLSGNQLSGKLGAEVALFPKLEMLNLARNTFEGSIPAEIGKMRGLKHLDLSSNNCLNQNSLTGSIPKKIGQLRNLSELHLFMNNLSGEIPVEIGSLVSMTELLLHNNAFTGPLPREVFQLVNLKELIASDNKLTGEIPHDVGKLVNLVTLRLNDNKMSGTLPREIGKLKSLKKIYLNKNKFTGTIPAAIGALQLSLLYFDTNEFTGHLPPAIGNLSSATHIALNNNQLTGPIPPEIKNLASVKVLMLNNNKLTGPIPREIGELGSLCWLHLDNNQLKESIPPEIGNLSNLVKLHLHRNQLSGEIPREICRLTNLMELSLSENQLTGPIPRKIDRLTKLAVLDLHANALTGEIPPGIDSIVHLGQLRLEKNMLAGPIPPAIGTLRNLLFVHLHTNQLSGRIPRELGNLSNLKQLCINNNQLDGVIPAELGKLQQLTILHLHNNQLSGDIPPQIGDMSELIALNLGGNQLEMPPPPELDKLTKLIKLNLL